MKSLSYNHIVRLLQNYNIVHYSAIHYSTVQHSEVNYSIVEYNTFRLPVVRDEIRVTLILKIPPRQAYTFAFSLLLEVLNWDFHINGVSSIAKLAFSSGGCPVMSSGDFRTSCPPTSTLGSIALR